MLDLDELDLEAKDVARLLSAGRCLIGAVLLVAPGRAMRAWLGEEPSPGLKHAARSMGARDIALGLGTLVTLDSGGPVSRWLKAQAIADFSDAFGTIVAFKSMPRFKRWGWLAMELGAGYCGLMLAEELGD